MLTTYLTLSDVAGEPQVRLTLPLLRLGDKVRLHAIIRRVNAGRHEELRVHGEFRVTALVLDTHSQTRQLLQVVSIGVVPHWQAVKTPITRFPLKSP